MGWKITLTSSVVYELGAKLRSDVVFSRDNLVYFSYKYYYFIKMTLNNINPIIMNEQTENLQPLL